MSVQSEIDRIITAVGNAYSKVSEKGGTVPASQTVANLATAIDSIPSVGTKETWVIKSDASGVFSTTQISFTSNGQKYTSIGANYDGAGTVIILYYDNNEIAGIDIMGGGVAYEFYNEADRTITFDTPPTGALLTWLQSNAVKQSGGGGLELVANVADGATVTATLGSNTVTGVSSGGQARIKIPQEGKWKVSATKGAQVSIPQEISVPATVDITLTTIQELNDTSWATIRQVSDAGAGANFWSVGDCKNIVLNGTVGTTSFNNETVSVFIIGFDHNAAVEGGGRIHFQLGKKNGTPIALADGKQGGYVYTAGAFIMNTSDVNTGGWADCQMRQTVLGSNSASATNPNAKTLLAALPEDLRAVMKPCTKYSDNVGGEDDAASAVTATSDWLFLLSEYEYFGERTYANSAEQNYQAQYAYYSAGNSKVMYWSRKTTAKAKVWCRSVAVEYGSTFCYVTNIGTTDWEDATADLGVSPGFCI